MQLPAETPKRPPERTTPELRPSRRGADSRRTTTPVFRIGRFARYLQEAGKNPQLMYLSIAVKLIVGIIGIILFLRISGKTQMAQLTPLDSVNAFVLGSLVGGVIYNPDTPVWYLVFAFAVWTTMNVSLRYLMRFRFVRKAIKGDTVMLVSDKRILLREFRRNGLEMEQFRTMLRENGIFSMFDVDDVRFETNGRLTITRRNEPPESYLLVNGGKIVEGALERCGKSKEWLCARLRREGYPDPEKLFCAEWTPKRGFYIVPLDETESSRKGQKTETTVN